MQASMFSSRPAVVIYIIIAVIGAISVLHVQNDAPYASTTTDSVGATTTDEGYLNATYTIDGQQVTLVHGIAETEAAPGSASKIVTKYFGNELTTDLNGDGRDDAVFLLTQQTGGSGTFYYAVAALETPDGYLGSDGYFLGDRIAPQTTELSQNPNQTGVVVVNYADRAAGDPMTTQPTVGKSVYLKLDAATMRWGIVEPHFSGESR